MALQTPRQRGLQRPSFGNTNTQSSPSLRASASAANPDINRKASLHALNTPSNRIDADLEVGDVVNVPGDMYGLVKFLGTVRGKTGKFVGVELDREFAARGKNDGDVDGIHYFNTTVPGAGIFLPVHRAEKRSSPTLSIDSYPATPNTPSHNALGYTGPKFSQSLGPAARPLSPTLKAKRPSLPRPESPLRRQPPNLAPTPARGLSASQSRTPRAGLPSTTPSKPNLKASATFRPSTGNTQPTRPYSRTGSRLGSRPDAVQEEDAMSMGAKSIRNGSISSGPFRSTSRLGSAGSQEAELDRLRVELAERDRRLAEQAANLSDMEASVKELSALLPAESAGKASFETITGDETTAQLRQMLREKNEKITILTSEFDAHRADFRSTLDSLEMASTETERVYEEQKRDLIAQVEELGARCQDMEEMNGSKKEFDDVARQLKQLEEFVQELEEGLEDARRGEAEARGEVEFLRGEVERGRSELKREREKAASMSGVTSSKELEQRDDEIRGLKAIIHSFSTNPDATISGDGFGKNSGEVQKLQDALSQSQKEKEGLEQELEQLRRDNAMTNGHHARNESEMTAVAESKPLRSRGDTIKATFAEHAARRGADGSKGVNGSALPGTSRPLFCDMCEGSDHDTLDCTQFHQNHDTSTEASEGVKDADEDQPPVEKPLPLDTGKENRDMDGNGAKHNGKTEDKWCALCEKDGHLAYECPDEQY